jgi:hypothetical protein
VTPTSTLPGYSWGSLYCLAAAMSEASTGDRDRLRDHARRVFEPRAQRRLSDEDLREIGENLAGLFAVLGEWARAERPEPAPQPSGGEGKAVTDDAAPRERSRRRTTEPSPVQ